MLTFVALLATATAAGPGHGYPLPTWLDYFRSRSTGNAHPLEGIYIGQRQLTVVVGMDEADLRASGIVLPQPKKSTFPTKVAITCDDTAKQCQMWFIGEKMEGKSFTFYMTSDLANLVGEANRGHGPQPRMSMAARCEDECSRLSFGYTIEPVQAVWEVRESLGRKRNGKQRNYAWFALGGHRTDHWEFTLEKLATD